MTIWGDPKDKRPLEDALDGKWGAPGEEAVGCGPAAATAAAKEGTWGPGGPGPPPPEATGGLM